jgi:D-amino-acid dehydrogenase
MTYDSVPILGPVPRKPNVFLAAGHSMLGVSMATSSGRLIAEMLSGDEPHVDPRPYAVERFS